MFNFDAQAPAPAPAAPTPRTASTTQRPTLAKPVTAAPTAPASAPTLPLTRIPPADLVALLDGNAAVDRADSDAARVLVIDVRPLSEYAAGHIKGAINLWCAWFSHDSLPPLPQPPGIGGGE
ncbi:hypothetical protein AMAG_07905 [Allomyces macrogynus ATCC 38327]|uniref:Rhodanese domain-containing protein n=1 Tax=Allomyces macrogynus (strain ATCC 38327) TaxID=578462 RepID=A0A0L0SJQ5_ALLM3|nr:hypothetical protein AMAG_07905 [Allomyces macrogynus ATCC 38327]|eukprot:KNE62718.1 hypothetical protein AMAG_07905 [Allomyces macrogynus ATCC 38327]